MTRSSPSCTRFGPAFLIQVWWLWSSKCAFKFLLFLKPIRGTSGNTFLCPSWDTRITCNSSKILLTSRNTGCYVMLKVVLFCFSLLLTFSKSECLEIAPARSISLRTIFLLQAFSNRYFSESLHLLSKNSLFERILLSLSARLYGIPFLQIKRITGRRQKILVTVRRFNI